MEHTRTKLMVSTSSFLLIFNNNAHFLDDLELPDGSLSASITNFGNEWRSDSSVSTSLSSAIDDQLVDFSAQLVLLQQILALHRNSPLLLR